MALGDQMVKPERDWNALGNIKDYITKLNKIRHHNRALREYENLRFHNVENEQILFYSKATGLSTISFWS